MIELKIKTRIKFTEHTLTVVLLGVRVVTVINNYSIRARIKSKITTSNHRVDVSYQLCSLLMKPKNASRTFNHITF
jgi:hypothetical protein